MLAQLAFTKNRLPKGGFFCLRFTRCDRSQIDREAPLAHRRQAGPRPYHLTL